MDPEAIEIHQMLHLLTCRCGLTHEVRPSHTGTAFQCPNCQEVFFVPRSDAPIQTISLVGSEQDERAELDARLRARAPGAFLTRADVRFDPPAEVVIEDAATQTRQAALTAQHRAARFRRDLFWTLFFFADARNVKPLFLCWLMLTLEISALLAALSSPFFVLVIFALILACVVEGLFCHLLLGAVDSASGGAEDLPGLPSVEELLGDWPRYLLEPLLLFGATCLFALGPAFTLFSVAWARSADITTLPLDAWITVGVTLAGGLVLWPILLLVAVHGEVADLFRYDLMMRTIRRTAGAYLTTVCFMGLVTAATAAGLTALAVMNSPLIPSGLLLAMVVAGVRSYGQIVAMRGLGVFSRHYKRDFAWDWS